MPEPALELPYPLIDICSGGEHFRFLCTEIVPEYRTTDAEQPTDFFCKFGAEYEGVGLAAHFGCDITAGNVYAFYCALDDIYDGLTAEKTAQLVNYGTLARTSFSVSFDKKGGCLLRGFFLNKDSAYQSGIKIHMQIDQSYISDSIRAMQRFFRTLGEAQGHFHFD